MRRQFHVANTLVTFQSQPPSSIAQTKLSKIIVGDKAFYYVYTI